MKLAMGVAAEELPAAQDAFASREVNAALRAAHHILRLGNPARMVMFLLAADVDGIYNVSDQQPENKLFHSSFERKV